MFNKIIIAGNMTRDVELRYLPSGVAIAVIGLASNRRYKKQDGSVVDEPCFVDVKLFARTAEIAQQYLHKGSKILIEGRLSYETWVDATGVKKSRHVIVAESMTMLDSKADTQSSSVDSNSKNISKSSSSNSQDSHDSIPDIDIDEEELPF